MGYAGLEIQNAVGFFFFLNSESITYQRKEEGLLQSQNKPPARPSQWPSYVHLEKSENWK